jgi:signal transduction histidine kinase
MDLLESNLVWFIDRLWTSLVWSLLVVLAMGFGVAFFLSSNITRPIAHLTEGAKAIGDGALDTQIPVESSDELGFLAQEFNLMAVKLKELDQLKDDFVSSVSHELRSPLSAIAGYVELLRSKPIQEILPEKREKAFEIIQLSTERLTHFINDILDLAKLKAGHVEIRPRSLNIKEMADGLESLFHPLLEKKRIEFTVDVPGNVPVIAADEEKIRQVLTNLVSNALKFTPDGGKIGISARNQTEFVQVSVSDSGPGIPEEAREAVFEKFKQIKSAMPFAGGQKGTGLGLAIARGNVEAHGGRIWIESAVGKGSVFHFTLPNRPAPPVPTPEF